MATEEKICPSCKNVFTCNAANILHCQCSMIKLIDVVKKIAEKEYEDCLCMQCLQQLVQQAATEGN